MNKARNLKVDGQINLRRPKIEDLMTRMKYGSPYEFRVMSGGSKEPREFTTQHAWNFYYRLMYAEYGWVIEFEKRMIGIARLANRGVDGQLRYSVGIFDESLLGKGIGTKVTKSILGFCFNELDLDSIELMVLDYNKRGIRCYEKSGFKVVNVLKDNHEMDGETFDDYIMVCKNLKEN